MATSAVVLPSLCVKTADCLSYDTSIRVVIIHPLVVVAGASGGQYASQMMGSGIRCTQSPSRFARSRFYLTRFITSICLISLLLMVVTLFGQTNIKKSPALFGSHRPSTTITLSTSCILYVTSGTSGLHAASIKTITIQSFLTFIFPLLTVVRRERFELPT